MINLTGLDFFCMVVSLLALGFGLGLLVAKSNHKGTIASRTQLLTWLEAMGGEEAVVASLWDQPAPTPGEALVLAEGRYLDRSGWDPAEDGKGWCPPWNRHTVYGQAEAIKKQRLKDSAPPEALNHFKTA